MASPEGLEPTTLCSKPTAILDIISEYLAVSPEIEKYYLICSRPDWHGVPGILGLVKMKRHFLLVQMKNSCKSLLGFEQVPLSRILAK